MSLACVDAISLGRAFSPANGSWTSHASIVLTYSSSTVDRSARDRLWELWETTEQPPTTPARRGTALRSRHCACIACMVHVKAGLFDVLPSCK
jgi:hypothetical protein